MNICYRSYVQISNAVLFHKLIFQSSFTINNRWYDLNSKLSNGILYLLYIYIKMYIFIKNVYRKSLN